MKRLGNAQRGILPVVNDVIRPDLLGKHKGQAHEYTTTFSRDWSVSQRS